jgi:glycosyltransferase involved in cell wall biosynthesis
LQHPHILVIPSWYPIQEEPLAGIFFFEQAHMMRSAGLTVGVVYPEIRPFKQLSWPLLRSNRFQWSETMEQGTPTYRVHGWNLYPGFLKGTMKLWVHHAWSLFKRYVQKWGRPDLIHAQSAIWGGVAAAEISRLTGIPFLIQEHCDIFLQPYLFEKRSQQRWARHLVQSTFAQASALIAVSRALEKGMQNYYQGKIHVLPNFIDVERLGNPQRPSLSKPFVFLTLAHLVKNKNIDLLLQAFSLFHQREPESKLLIAGDGVEVERLKKLCQTLDLNAHVEFLGGIPRPQLQEVFARAHAFILPSQRETFGVVFIEALALGLPVIGTACGGPEDIITPDVGILIKKIDKEDVAQAMLRLKFDYSRYDPLHLKTYAQERFGKQETIEKWIHLYKQTLQG